MAIRLEVLSHKVNGEGVGGRRAAQFAGTHRRTSGDELEQSSNSRAVSGIEQGGFFLRKKPPSINGLPLQQLKNCYNWNSVLLTSHEDETYSASSSSVPKSDG